LVDLTQRKGFAVRRIVHPLFVGFVLIVGVLGFAGSAAAQPTAAPPAKPQPVNTTECTPVTADGYQLCSSEKGTLQLVPTPGAPPFYRLSLTYVRELHHNGTVAYRGDEQHGDFDFTKTSAGPPANQFVRTGAVLVTPSVTCTYDDSSVVTGNALHRQLSNLACTPEATASPGASAPAGPGAGAAAKPAPAPTPLPTYSDYSAVDNAPNGLTTHIRYGTDGMGSTETGSCTQAGTDFQTKINSAAAGAVICVQPGDYSKSTMTINKAITVRAVRTSSPDATAKVKNIIITGSNATVDGFNVVGGTLGNPNYAIKFSGTGHKIINNLVRGRGIYYAIGCEQSAGCGSNVLVSGNTITGVHNFGIYLWGGDHITVEKNNIFDLYQSKDVDDVDATRAWGDYHVIRNNYIHDINGNKSAGAPHVDCYQTYQAGSGSPRYSGNIDFENNYCVRVTGQCFIAQNDQRATAELHDFTLRGNVCETYGWQVIEFDGIPRITLDNDYVAGAGDKFTTVLNFANSSPNGYSSHVKLRNNILVRGSSGSRYLDNPAGEPEDNTANIQKVDTGIATSYNNFINVKDPFPPVNQNDFTFYRKSAAGGDLNNPSPNVVDKGQTPNSIAAIGGFTTDVDGAARKQGASYDIGPFEFK
jgi:parallel beta-helix repeat protein